MHTERIHMETQMLDKKPGEVVAFAEFVASEALPVEPYEKVVREYPRLSLPPEAEWDHIEEKEGGHHEEKDEGEEKIST